tara:strand:- start:313 stop:453 length:141 start_codon:yes stop_codon:yes gene_type:complete
MKYILTDYAGVEEDEEPHMRVFKNKDEVIQQLLSWVGEQVTLEVKK